ncbi:MAG TPA: plastocyanin/azurin family copper-binding protein [Dehalococcoidia bacterium]|nr:plastocyanin/azurin family copper-binding protein [Dehalococcoidia bacterium]
MSTRRPGNDWQRTLWESASALSLAAIAAVAVVAAALVVLVAGNASVPAVIRVTVGQQNGGAVKADQYNPASIGISQGDTIRWEWSGGVHDVTAYAETAPGTPEWQSSLMTAAGHFYQRQFLSPGTFTYYCSIHAFAQDAAPAVVDQNIAAGKMVGKVVVAPPATPTPSPSPAPTPSPSPTADPGTSPPPTPDSSSTPTPLPSTAPTDSPSPSPEPTDAATPAPEPSESPAPTGGPSTTRSPAPTDKPQPSPGPTAPATPLPSPSPSPVLVQFTPTPPAAPPPPAARPPMANISAAQAPSRPATATPAPAPASAPATLTETTASPEHAVSAQPAALAAAGAPPASPAMDVSSLEDGGSISPLFRLLTLSLTGLLIAIVISGFIWIERSQGDQPR